MPDLLGTDRPAFDRLQPELTKVQCAPAASRTLHAAFLLFTILNLLGA